MNLKIKALHFARKPTPEEIRFGYGSEAHCFFSWSRELAARRWIKRGGHRWYNRGGLMVPAGTQVWSARNALDSGPKF